MKLEQLANKEMSLIELDNTMVELGYNSENEWVNWDEIVNNKQIPYTKDGEHHVTIEFEVLFTHGEDENASATYIKINAIH
jgi:hypothetical protein